MNLGNVAAKPHSHLIAMSLNYERIRDPERFLSTFPNGGVPKILRREARVYLCDLDAGSIDLVAIIPDYAGIPQPKSVWIEGWQGDDLFFSLFGYGGDARTGDDLSDPRRLLYQVTADGATTIVDTIPAQLGRGRNSGPEPDPPFLRWSQGHLSVEIAIDARVREATRLARVTFQSDSGEPVLSMP